MVFPWALLVILLGLISAAVLAPESLENNANCSVSPGFSLLQADARLNSIVLERVSGALKKHAVVAAPVASDFARERAVAMATMSAGPAPAKSQEAAPAAGDNTAAPAPAQAQVAAPSAGEKAAAPATLVPTATLKDSTLPSAGAPATPLASAPAAAKANTSSSTLKDVVSKAAAEENEKEIRRMIVPLPVYIHEKENETDSIGKALGNDLLGDALEPTDKGHHVLHHFIVLMFLFGCLVIGCGLLWTIERYLPSVPYTCALFLTGLATGAAHWYLTEYRLYLWPSWNTSVLMWVSIDPHLLFFVFLPPLLFAEAMSLNVQLAKKCFSQALILACPGVLFGAFMTAVIGKYVLPYGWDWPIAMVFGAILAATDPVAVVALFKSLGVSPRLTMLISGESLLNDGTAIVLFQLFLKITLGAQVVASDIIIFVAHMTLVAVAVGVVVGSVSSFCISHTCGEHFASDSIIQLMITICTAYAAFFLAESTFSTSGVLATVTAGVVVAKSIWPCIVSRETIHIVWEAIEFKGNTLVFFLAGLIFAEVCLKRRDIIQPMDYALLLVLYFVTTGIRMLMVATFLVPLNNVGTPLSIREAAVIVWSGLRGAVGLAMAIIVDMEPGMDRAIGSRIVFHVGGIAALTTLINASTMQQFMKWLGLIRTHKLQEQTVKDLEISMANNVHALFDSHLKTHTEDDIRFNGADPDLVVSWVPALQMRAAQAPSADFHKWTTKEEMQFSTRYRHIFLNVVQKEYWDAIHDGIVPRKSFVAQVLLDSTNEARHTANQALTDWVVVERIFGDKRPSLMHKLSQAVFLPFVKNKVATSNGICEAMLSFLQAHAHAQEHVPLYFGKGDPLAAHISQQINNESEQQCQLARQRLAELPEVAIMHAKSRMLAQRILDMQKDEVQMWKKKGVITEQEAEILQEQVHNQLRRIQ